MAETGITFTGVGRVYCGLVDVRPFSDEFSLEFSRNTKGPQRIEGVYCGVLFIWPDSWIDIWDEGNPLTWEDGWRDRWTTVAAPESRKAV